MSLISNLGLRYCNDMMVGALVVHNNRTAQLVEFTNTGCNIQYLDPAGGRDFLDEDFFTGWRVLAYPPLGYRRIGNIIYHVHRQQTAYRGIRANVLAFEFSPLSNAMRNTEDYPIPNNNERMCAVMMPQYDNRASLDALVRGSLFGVVPNEDICIEPSMTANNYVVLYRGKIVGTMDSNKRFDIPNPAVLSAVTEAFSE